MNVVIRFLSNEVIENCVTCLNYKIDKVIFFGYKEMIDEEKENISIFLKDKCHTDSEFVMIENNGLSNIMNMVAAKVNDKDYYYMDITGCEGVCLIAFTNMAYELSIPMHIYDVRKRKTYNIDDSIPGSIRDVKERTVDFKINDYIKMVGGLIRSEMNTRSIKTPDKKVLKKIADIIKDYKENWMHCVGVLNRMHKDKDSLYTSTSNIAKLIREEGKIRLEVFMKILMELSKNDLIRDLKTSDNKVSFIYTDDKIRKYLSDGGIVLEEQAYQKERKRSDDAMMSVHLDWDGVVERSSDGDVVNEIDVLSLRGYLPVFISCKDTSTIEKNALYELESITRRFGGKYAKMILVTSAKVGQSDINRARHIGIEVINSEEF